MRVETEQMIERRQDVLGIDRPLDRITSLAIGGAHPFADPAFAGLEAIDAGDPEAFLRGIELVVGEPLSDETRKLLLQNDRQAVIASLRQRVSLEDVLPELRVPCWLFAGPADRRYDLIVRARQARAGTELLSLPGLGHLETLASADRVLPPLMDFLAARSP